MGQYLYRSAKEPAVESAADTTLAELKGEYGAYLWKGDLLYPVWEEDGNTLPCIAIGRS